MQKSVGIIRMPPENISNHFFQVTFKELSCYMILCFETPGHIIDALNKKLTGALIKI